MSYDDFHATYALISGPVRLGQWECTDEHRPVTRLGPQARNYRATIAVGDRISTSTAAASGPIAALTAMLYERGVAVEMLKFHQVPQATVSRRSCAAPTVPQTNGRWACPATRPNRRCGR